MSFCCINELKIFLVPGNAVGMPVDTLWGSTVTENRARRASSRFRFSLRARDEFWIKWRYRTSSELETLLWKSSMSRTCPRTWPQFLMRLQRQIGYLAPLIVAVCVEVCANWVRIQRFVEIDDYNYPNPGVPPLYNNTQEANQEPPAHWYH